MNPCRRTLRGLSLAALSLIGACADDGTDGAVTANVTVYGSDESAVSAASIVALNGTYTSCLDRSGAWSMRVSGALPLEHDALSVVTGDAGCVLTLTEIVADQKYTTMSSIPLTAAYQGSSVAFVPAGGGATAFFANAKLDATTFTGDFVISLLQSGEPSISDAGNVFATYATVQTAVQATVVPAPDYTISFTAGTPLTVQFDAAKTVTSVAGTATLLDGTVAGTSYVIDLGTLAASPNFLAVQTVFLANTAYAIAGANPTIPAARFGLSGVSLVSPVVRTVVVGRLLGGVLGYELIKVTFKSP